jgi:hypothetical protein
MVTSQYAPAKQAGNGVIVAFNFSFKILATSDLVVSKLDANGVSSGTLILGTDYTVTFDPIAETGTVTFTVAVVNGGFAVIARNSNNQQQTSLPREGSVPAKTVETMIDKLTMLVQEDLVGNTETPAEASGLYASKPVTPLQAVYYYSTDKLIYEKWVPAMQKWILLG